MPFSPTPCLLYLPLNTHSRFPSKAHMTITKPQMGGKGEKKTRGKSQLFSQTLLPKKGKKRRGKGGVARVWGKTNKEGVRGAGKEDKGMKIGNMRREKGRKQKEKKG